jgi:hypothetical protein
VRLVAEHGWKLLGHYELDVTSGRWTHRGRRGPAPMRLLDLRYRGGQLEHRSRHATEPEWVLESYLDDARRILESAPASYVGWSEPSTALESETAADVEALRWFPLPREVVRELSLASDASLGASI